MLPEQQEFTAEEAREWLEKKHGYCTKGMIRDYVKSGKLKGKTGIQRSINVDHVAGKIIIELYEVDPFTGEENCIAMKRDRMFSLQELQQLASECCTTATPEPATGGKATAKKTGDNIAPITTVIEVFLDEKYPDHTKPIFYEFVKQQLARKADKKKDDNFTFSVKKIGTGTSKGLFMDEPKAGKEGLSEQDFWYSDKDIGERLGRARAARKSVK